MSIPLNGRPAFFHKSKIDLDLGALVVITITDAVATDTGSSVVNYLRDRRNDTGWGTQGSNDSANTQLDIDMGDLHSIDSLHLLGINWKSYTVKYSTDNVTFLDFSTVINPTTNANAEQFHQFTAVEARYLRIVVLLTIIVNDDKRSAQIVPTKAVGQFADIEPKVGGVTHGRNRRSVRMVSGKVDVRRGVGAFACNMSKTGVISTADLTIVETLFDYRKGFLVWLCGGTTTQFRTQRQGYRKKDLYLMNCANDWSPDWKDGYYQHGTEVDMDLVEQT